MNTLVYQAKLRCQQHMLMVNYDRKPHLGTVGRDCANVCCRQSCSLQRFGNMHQDRCFAAVADLHMSTRTGRKGADTCSLTVAWTSADQTSTDHCASSPSLRPSSPPSVGRRQCPETRHAALGPQPSLQRAACHAPCHQTARRSATTARCRSCRGPAYLVQP